MCLHTHTPHAHIHSINRFSVFKKKRQAHKPLFNKGSLTIKKKNITTAKQIENQELWEDDRTDPGEDHQGPSHTVRVTKQAQPCSHGQPAKGTFLKDLARRHSLATEQPGTCPGAGSQTQTCGRRLERRPFSSTKWAGAASCHGAPLLCC